MSRTRFALTFLFALSAISSADARADALFARKTKVDEAKARTLVETLKSDPDEKKRKIAADELGGADPRICPEVAPALVVALRKDTSAAVRVEAAEALRQLGEVSPQAGAALEAAVDSDPSPLVRIAAKRALWAYHLSGYRTAKNGDNTVNQTIEPPIASPSGPRQVVALIPAPPVPVVVLKVQPIAAPVPQLPPVAVQPMPQPGPRVLLPNVLPGPRNAIRSALNLGPLPAPSTDEPPMAKTPAITMSTQPKHSPEPPLSQRVLVPAVPEFVPTLPPFQPDLPSVVSPPLPISKLKQTK
ncbi:HEAT repeat domain-containing protein [Gemmata sp. G18]|uniref:HEAT repeat domain-containing protein n=1 Tax=Gemmata palustris TaxID=2822762 RepID=A0ABS5BVX4_9BACT|nr:HEAT repeat domain-containing protein [Gemmata palustris]MBP3957876.1 HEAT repeat domain-containing protein [Gemmata palustris]